MRARARVRAREKYEFALSFTKQFFTFHSNKVKCERQIYVLSVGFESTNYCIRGKRLTARLQPPHSTKRTTQAQMKIL